MASTTFGDTAAGGQAAYPGAAAWAASQLGLRVFPLSRGTGTPVIKGWPELATTDPDQISDWWCGEFAGAGVGIATGPESGIYVLDIDAKNGVNGFATLQSLCEAHGSAGSAFAETMTVATPSGGAHLYFRWNAEAGEGAGVHNSTGTSDRGLGPGLDVRGIRGYVRGPGWGGYQVVPRGGIRSVAIYAAPSWLTALAIAAKRSHGRDDHNSEGSFNTERSVMSPERSLDRLGAAAPGTRNDALNRAAFRLGLSGAVEREAAWAECRTVMFSIGAGDSEDAQRRTFESGWNAGVAKRRA